MYSATRIITQNPETGDREINPGITQAQFDLISQETKTLQDNIDELTRTLKDERKRIDRPRFSRIFMHL